MPSLSGTRRTPRQPARRGSTLKKGDKIMAMLVAANMDPDTSPYPEKLDLTRRPNRHLSARPHRIARDLKASRLMLSAVVGYSCITVHRKTTALGLFVHRRILLCVLKQHRISSQLAGHSTASRRAKEAGSRTVVRCCRSPAARRECQTRSAMSGSRKSGHSRRCPTSPATKQSRNRHRIHRSDQGFRCLETACASEEVVAPAQHSRPS